MARLQKHVSVLHNRLKEYNSGEKKKYFEAWLDNVQMVVDIIPALNFTQDPKIEEIRLRVERELLGYSNEYLKEADHARENVQKAAADILAQMAGYCGF